MTARSLSTDLACESSDKPSIPGRLTSQTTIAGTSGTMRVAAVSASVNGSTSKSASSSACFVPSSTSGSSSTSNTLRRDDMHAGRGCFHCRTGAGGVSSLGLVFSVFKRLRQADQHSAHERGIILCERMHDLQASLARGTHGSLRFPCVHAERLLHLRAGVSSPAWDVVKNGFPLLLGVVARLLGGLLDAVEELFFKRLELLESFFHARFLEARAAFGQFLQRDVIGFDHLEQGLIHPRECVREGFFHIDLAFSNANVNAFGDLAHHAVDLLQAQFAHLQRLKREVANGGAYLFVFLYRLGGHRLEHLVRIDRWGFHLMSPASREFTYSVL